MNLSADSPSTNLDDQKCIGLVSELVGIQSYSGNEAEAVNYLVGKMVEFGYAKAYADQSGSAIGIRNDHPSSLTIVLLGHIDTVPGQIPVRINDGVLYGRGSVDAKGPLAAFVAAGAMASLPAGIRLIVAGAVEEESATSKGARQISDDFHGDYCIIGEPSSSSAITLGYKGRLLIKYQVEADEGHTAGPTKNAAELACEFWQSIQAYAKSFNNGRDKLFDQLLPSLRDINSGSDGLTSSATVKIGCRLPPDFDVSEFQSQLDHFGKAGRVETHGYESAYQSNRNNTLVRSISQAIRRQGKSPKYKLKTGTSDLNVVGPIWNCPIVAYGPGDSSLDHTPNEHLCLDEYLQSIQVLKQAIELLCESIVTA